MVGRSETAVCIVRVERQSAGILITLTISQDIASGLHEMPIHYSDVSAAMNGVAAFLDGFENGPS